MRTFYRSSLFCYFPSDDGYTYDAYRVTVYTFGRPARKKTLKKSMEDFLGAEAEFPKFYPDGQRRAYEKRQVAATDSKKLGFSWLEFSKLRYRGRTLSEPEQRLAVWNLSAYETLDLRLGYSEFLGKAAQYGRDKRDRLSVGRAVKSFWEWLAS